jgi:phage N-6-adenine-methyltransferase
MTSVHFSSKTDLWETPADLFGRLDAEFHFTLDVCAVVSNAKCAHFFSPQDNGLTRKWSGVCWMNPPYGREIGKWMRKAWIESESGGVTVVCLIPARTDTAWFQDYAMKGEIRFLRGRLKFSNAKYAAPFPSAIIIFRATKNKPIPKRSDPTWPRKNNTRNRSYRRP